jgi:UDP-glucose 4-epimerase
VAGLQVVADGDRTVVIGAGFIGAAVARAIAAQGSPVTVLTRATNSPPPLHDAAIRVVLGDATDPAALDAALLDAGSVVFCAGAALPAEAESDPAGELTQAAQPLLATLEALRRRRGVRLLFCSSGGTVYGEPDQIPVHESHPLRSESAYGMAKVTAEHYLQLYASRHGVPTTALRCANVYGPGQVPFRSQGLVATLLASAATGREVVVFGDGSAVRDYVYIDDVAQATVELLEHDDLPAAINVGTGVGTSVEALLQIVERTVGRPLRVRHEPARPSDLRRVVLDVTRLRSLVPFDAVSIVEGLERTWAYQKAAAHA